MPFPFSLPTTSHLSFQSHYSCPTHPSLLATATSHRSVLRAALKKHKRLPPSAQTNNLPAIQSAINEYLPYLLAVDAGLSGRSVAGEDVDIILNTELAVEWRPMLSSGQVPSRDPPRVKGSGLDYEIAFVVHTLATVQILLAREQLLTLYAESLPSPEQRLTSIQNASRYFMAANSLHTFLVQRYSSSMDTASIPSGAIDIQPIVQGALSSLSLAEATLLFVLKDDPYPALTIQTRSKTDKEWMIKAPEIPKVRAHLFARLSLAASEHASKASASLSSAGGSKISGDITRYAEDLRRVSRAKACRFLGLDSDLSGKTGEGIAWLRAGLSELGQSTSSSSASSLSKLKSSLKSSSSPSLSKPNEKTWGIDAGLPEEVLTISSLEKKWVKVNDTINVQIVPESGPLVAGMPSGRDVHSSKAWKPTLLGGDEVARMKAPVDEEDLEERMGGLGVGDSSDEEAEEGDRRGKGGGRGGSGGPVGAFPGTKGHYGGGGGGGEGGEYY